MVPETLHTDRLYLRSWQGADAGLLLPVLEANVDHLGDWIPAHVAAPASLEEIELRLAGFARDFQTSQDWRYAIFAPDQGELLGEISLFPRSAGGRAPFASADRLEIGYWLRRDATGKGYATEAALAMLELARTLPGMIRVEIHCDAENAPSAAVPRRLGFRNVSPSPSPDGMLWIYGIHRSATSDL